MRLLNLIKNLWLFTAYIKQKLAKPNYKTALLRALLLAYSLRSSSFLLCTSLHVLKHPGVQYKWHHTKSQSHYNFANQHFIANHMLTNQVQLLLTKPWLDSLALTLIRPQNSKAKPNSRY